ncbi:MAG: GAF domain-containing protein [Chloroflexi bacterium]|nr:GAF domain-containing protein [Chloroflexota bacterium]
MRVGRWAWRRKISGQARHDCHHHAKGDRLHELYRSLLEATRAAVSSLAPEEVLDRVLRGICSLLGAHAAAAWRVEPDGTFRRLAAIGLSEAYLQGVAQLPIDETVTGRAVRESRITMIREVDEEPLVHVRDLLEREGISSFVSAPLLTRGRAIGTLNVYRRDAYDYSPEELELLFAFANQAAAAIENARLYAATERALAEMSAQKQTLDGIINSAQDGIVLVDDKWRVQLFSPGAEKITGWRSDVIVGKSCSSFLRCHPAGAGPLCETNCPMSPLFAMGSEQIRYSEMLINTGDGRERWIGASWALTHSAGNGRPMAVMVMRDITAAKEVDQMKSAIISLVSHELRTPLTSIRALSELMVRHEFDAHQGRELLGNINRESERMSRLIENILEVARIEAGKIPFHPQPVDLRVVCEEAIAPLADQQTTHTFNLEIPDDLPLVYADPGHLRQIVDNLLSNAVKYAPDGGLVSVEAGVRDDVVEVRVSDEGVGVPTEHLTRIFERFFRVDGQHHARGTGLGLHIARSLVELHGGRIWAESEPGRRGSRFVFQIPFRRAEPEITPVKMQEWPLELIR